MIARVAAALAVLAACSRDAPGPPLDPTPTPAAIDRALRAGGAFLASHVGPDGAVRSKTYAALKDGWSLTPLAALALRIAPRDAAATAACERAVAHVGRLPDAPRAEVSYPLYAYAIGALVLGAPEHVDRHRGPRDALLARVRGQQMAGASGWQPEDASFGGWGYATDVPRRPAGPIRDDLLTANLSATVLAVGAIALAGTPAAGAALAAARDFVASCQNADGGFFFSPALPDGNKAGPAPGGGYRSYGSMTADGLRALLRLGHRADDPRVAAAAAWLEHHFDPARNPGDFVATSEIRRASSYYYWAWSAAHALTHVGKPVLATARGDVRWAEALATELLRRQGKDGAWRNPASEMREDDPLVATAFAVAALALCRGAITGERPAHAAWR